MIDNRPIKLYKYFSPQRWTFFQDLRLRYSPFGAFNDPFEGRPEVTALGDPVRVNKAVQDAVGETVKEIYGALSVADREKVSLEKVMELASTSEMKVHISEALSDALRMSVSQLANRFDQTLGALCLCEERYNLLMWAHYAESHSGFQLEFDPTLVAQNKDGSTEHLFRICYQERRPSGRFDQLTESEIMLSKSSHWSYEREWRIFRTLASAVVTHPATPYPICLFDVLPKAVTGIVFGARMDPAIEANIRNAINANSDLEHVRLYRAQPDYSHYFLNYVAA